MNKDDKVRLREEYKLIAEFLGWHYIPYDAESDSKLWAGWHKAVKVNTEDPPKLGVVVGGKNPGFITRKTLDLNFRYDWRNLMEVVVFIESLKDRKHGGLKLLLTQIVVQYLPNLNLKKQVIIQPVVVKETRKKQYTKVYYYS